MWLRRGSLLSLPLQEDTRMQRVRILVVSEVCDKIGKMVRLACLSTLSTQTQAGGHWVCQTQDPPSA